MKTWQEIKHCIRTDMFGSKEERETNNYKDYVDSLVHYIKLGLANIGATYKAHKNNDYRVAVLFEREGKLYAVECSNWRLDFEIHLCESVEEFNFNKNLWFCTKHTWCSFDIDNPETVFQNVRLPNHAKFQVDDVVRIQSKSVYRYYGSDNNGKLGKITKVNYESNSITYDITPLHMRKVDSCWNYPEGSLRKIRGGV